MMNDILTKYAAVPPPSSSSSSFRRRRRSARTRWDKWEREANERAESWRDEFLILGFTVGRRRKKRKGERKRKWQLHLEALQGCFSISRRAVLPTIVTSASFFSFSFSLPQSIMKRCNLFMGCSGSTCEIVWQIQPSYRRREEKCLRCRP